jgi:TetR/AcrR family fatty acid metabolism transcriptional regulator
MANRMRQKKQPATSARSLKSARPKTRPRSLVPQTKGERTRARLVAAAIEQFGSRGFERTTVSHIVRGAKVSQPAFYLYFSSKDEIYQHLVKRVRTELRDVIKRARVPPDLPEKRAADKARLAVEAFLQYFTENPKLASIGYFEAESSSTIRDDVSGFLAQNISAEQSAGYFRHSFQSLFLSDCYNGSLDRVIQKYLLTGKSTAAELADRVADIYLNGMLPRHD